MCGIVGIINRSSQKPEMAVLTAMAEKLAHRGPDDEGYFLNGSVGFYHKRLSIIDLEHGKQPMYDNDNVIVFNGEIYNYIELRYQLKQRGHSFQTTSDTEVILKMYLEYGVSFIDKLNGMFAFLIYDRKKHQIIAARDHFGIKPLYYHFNKECFLFASEIKALLQHPSVSAQVNYDSVQDYITFQYVLGENTLFKNINKLLPGHYQVIDLESQKVETVCYWEPRFGIDISHTENYFTCKIKELLDDTIKIQMRSDVPVGAYLSGGIDSSVVTTLASKYGNGTFKTFTGGFHEGAEFNEVEYAKQVAGTCQAEVYEVYPTVKDFVNLMPKLIYHMDEPVAGPGLFPQYMVSEKASSLVKVVLGGQGGDEIFGGYARYVIAYLEQAIKGAIFESNEEGEHIVSLQSILPNLSYLKSYIPMMQYFMQDNAFEAMDLRYFRLVDRGNSTMHFYHQDFIKKFDDQAIFSRFQKVFNHPDTLSYFNKMIHYDMVCSLPALLQVEDRVSMAVSLESRVPLLDRRIVDLVTSMPPGMKFKGAEMKYIFKRAIKNIIPDTILNRKDKMGFPVPLHIWAKNGGGSFIRDVLLSKKARERGIINGQEVEKLIKSERSFGRQLWGLLCLELWFNQFIDVN